ncbi:MAG TPA: phosphoribosylanthranilate isomerase [Verrucomicrobiae bacterium]|nr:phosphoribosylanthranilate isomerase [Verrucomicrobiae bacterium]
MTWVKICGMTNLEDALVAVEAGADAVGFVFYEKSPRCVTVETAREIARRLPERIDRIGVFVNEVPEHISEITDEAGLTAVQFHGDEWKNPGEYSVNRDAFFGLPMLEMVRDPSTAIHSLRNVESFPNLAGFLLDSGTAEKRGGTGKAFPWGDALSFSSLKTLRRIVIAGGLTPDNVGRAVGYLKPWGVDVASGVEARPGKKDPEKVRAFVQAVREYDRKAG